MDDWVWWLVVAVAFAAGEIATLGFFLGPFAVGALIACVVSAAGAGFVVSGLVFLVASAAAFGGGRPVLRRHARMPSQLRTYTAALVGRRATVVEPVTRDAGCVRIDDGEVWTA